VLVVDDSDLIRNVLRSMLEEASVEVVEAANGADALDQLHRDPTIGLVFLDLNLPDMKGMEVLRSIRGGHRATLPVVLLSGDSSLDVAQARSLGAAGWLSKPVHWQAIQQIAKRFLG
jgi:CheY-like chemotaxis protein